MATQTFTFTGAEQTWVIPTQALSPIVIECWGAQGGPGRDGTDTGHGGYVKGSLEVTPGETLYLYVGGHGQTGSGWNGGANGGGDYGGGGATDVRQGGNALSNRKIVGGGGGGGGHGNAYSEGYNGDGGGGASPTGHNGGMGWQNPSYSDGTGGRGGNGGSQTAGGAGGSGFSTAVGSPNGASGTLGVGGVGGTTGNVGPGGGGGGGYYGGGGGGCPSDHLGVGGGGGGGGSSYVGGVTNTTVTNATRAGNGQITITYTENTAPNAPTLSAPAASATVNNNSSISFSWTHGDPEGDTQDAYSLRRSTDAGATWTYWNGSSWTSTQTWIATANQTVSIPGSLFSDRQSYQWSVATRDPRKLTGPYATARTFTISDAAPVPVLVAPSSGSTVSNANDVTFQWDIGDPGDTQSAYILRRKRRP